MAVPLQPAEKTAFLRHLYIKTMILPRQARDKHRESSKKNEDRGGKHIDMLPSFQMSTSTYYT
jgi:hypothetical protein